MDTCPCKASTQDLDDLLSIYFIANWNLTITEFRPIQSPWRYSRSDSRRGIPSIRAFGLGRLVSVWLTRIQGGSAAHRLFHTQILPIIASAPTVPLSKEMRTTIDDMCKQFGGRGAPIIPLPVGKKFVIPNQLHQIEQVSEPEVVETPQQQQRRLYGR